MLKEIIKKISTIWESETKGVLSWTRVILTPAIIALTFRIISGDSEIIKQSVIGLAILSGLKVVQSFAEKIKAKECDRQ